MGNNESTERERDVAQSCLQNANATIDSLKKQISSIEKQANEEKVKLNEMINKVMKTNTDQVSFFV